MKRTVLFLFACIAFILVAQVPQRFNKVIVTGDITSPKFIRTGSTVDSVLLGNGSARAVNSIKTDTASLSKRINSKQDTLPFPEVRTGDTFLNDLGLFSAPPSSGGGSASGTPVYFLPTNSPTSGYLELDYTPYTSVVENTYSIPVGTTLLSSHLTDLQIAATTIDAGNWYISSRSKVNNLSGSTKLHVDFFLYHLDGTTTVLFGSDSETFSTTDYKIYQGQLPEASFPCATTDRLGVSIYAINSGGSTKTLTISLGNGIATFFSSPLRIRHSNLRDKNGEAAFQHLTSEQVSKVNATSGTNTGDETKTTIQNKLGAASFTNSGYLTSTEWGEFKGKVTFPGFGTTHTTAAYGDHNHSGVYEVPLTFSTGLTRTGNTITNNITQYTDVLARAAQTNSSIITALGYTPWHSGNHPTTLSGYGITDAPWTGYLPLSGGTLSGALILKEGSTNGLRFPNDAFGGSGDNATITLQNPSGAEATRMTFTMTNDADDLFSFVAPSVNGMLMNGNIVWNAGNFSPSSKLDYRTFGTAANSATGDFIQNQNSSAQSGNMWINGKIRNSITNNASFISNWVGSNWFGIGSTTANHLIRLGMTDREGVFQNAPGDMLFQVDGSATFASTVNATQLQSTVATGTAPFTVNSTTMVSNLNSNMLNGKYYTDFAPSGYGLGGSSIINADANNYKKTGDYYFVQAPNSVNNDPYVQIHVMGNGSDFAQIGVSSDYNFGFRWANGSWRILNSIATQSTGSLLTNNLPKWNGSSFVYSLISDNGTYVNLNSSTQSTSLTTGALVTPGGIGVGGVSHFGDDIVASGTVEALEFVKSGGTSSQFLKANGSVDATNYQPAITLTTNGTSGAATFSGGTLNIPNYGSSSSSGTYTATITGYSGGVASGGVDGICAYQKVGTMYHIALTGHVISNVESGTPINILFSVPSSVTAATCIPIVRNHSTTTALNSHFCGYTPTGIMIQFTPNAASGTQFDFDVIAMYY